MENAIEINMENEMESGIIWGFVGLIVEILIDPKYFIIREVWYHDMPGFLNRSEVLCLGASSQETDEL